MLARHPVTGKEIRVIQVDTSLWKEKKTLLYSRNQHPCFDTVGLCGSGTLLEIQLNPFSSLEEFSKAAKQVKLLFVSRNVIEGFSVKEIREAGISNIICLEEMNQLFPHLGESWNGSLEDAVTLVAGVLRYRVIRGINVSERATNLGISMDKSPVPRLWWVTQYYHPSKPKRKREIDLCLQKNAKSSLIDKVILLNETDLALPEGCVKERIEQHVIGHRITYLDVLEEAVTFPEDVIVAFANADICIDDESWKDLWTVNLEDKFLALLRYDVPESKNLAEAQLFGPRADSQDTWVIRAADLKKRDPSSWKQKMNIPFGKAGCDNAIAIEFFRQKFLVTNPCLSLRTWHFHSSNMRTYDPLDIVDTPFYMHIQPTGFQDLQPLLQNSGKDFLVPSPLHRFLRGSGAQTWAMKMNKTLEKGQESWQLLTNNPLTPQKEETLRVKNCFMTEEGLCFDNRTMYIGPSERAQKFWMNHPLHGMVPTLECKKAIAVPFEETVMKNREDYLLYFAGKVLRARSSTGDGNEFEFFAPDKKEILETLNLFNWGVATVPVIKYEKNIHIWCHEALVQPVASVNAPYSEDIQALRKSVKLPSLTHAKPRLVLVEDERVLTNSLSTELEDRLADLFDIRVVYAGRTSAERILDCFAGASGVVIGSGLGSAVWGWNWLLKEGSFVFEVGCDRSVNDGALTLSAAGNLQHRFVGSLRVKEILEEIHAAGLSAVESDGKVTVWLPRKNLEGFFSHAGDSFREMAELWGERGYCSVREHPTAVMCWWGAVGEKGTLLYDRPTHEWRLAAPMAEKSWKYALFGNPKPPSVGNSPAGSWFFWPRRPRLVEDLVSSNAHEKGWEERREEVVFYGKIENKVQEKRRSTESWEVACEKGEFVLVRGAETKYPFTQKEYLEKLASARFGLCLAGYGLKCHREVECMAMGCVPLVAPDVDMDAYADPPVAGIHFIRVTTPEEARDVAAKMSKESWEKMSEACHAWWKKNCSCEGSFKLTQELISEH